MIKIGRGIIIIKEDEKNQLITIKRVKKIDNETKIYYTFPGGHVEEGETCSEATIREIEEELGIKVEIKSLLCKINNTELNRYEEFFECEYLSGNIGSGTGEEWQEYKEEYGSYEIVKIDIKDLSKYNLLPIDVKKIIIKKY